MENEEFLTSQIITYLGNKRALLPHIEKEIVKIEEILGRKKLICADIFSGSGIVARKLKEHSSHLIANDLENYSKVINSCYLSNKTDFDEKKWEEIKNEIECRTEKSKIEGIISSNYAPKDTENVQPGERCFYSRENALLIDSYRFYIEEILKNDNFSRFFLAPLVTEASVHVNTSGVFKGFYKRKSDGIGCFGGDGKNALSRILGPIQIKKPIFSNFESDLTLYKEDALVLVEKLKNIDVAYLDPPYNQHPYGSNYFMLNLIIENKIPPATEAKISRVSGIPSNWNHSSFNRRIKALDSMEKTISALDSKFCIISYNSEGFISFDEMKAMLEKYGKVETVAIDYYVFRGSRNLRNRPLNVNEYLFILEKK